MLLQELINIAETGIAEYVPYAVEDATWDLKSSEPGIRVEDDLSVLGLPFFLGGPKYVVLDWRSLSDSVIGRGGLGGFGAFTLRLEAPERAVLVADTTAGTLA